MSYILYYEGVHLPLPVDVHVVQPYPLISLVEDQQLLYELL